jgi:putative oxidoreductase
VTAKTLDYGLLIIRLVLGTIMLVHGSQKLFTFGYSGVAAGMGQAGLPAPQIAAALIIAAEFGGGLALIAGLLTRFSAASIAFAMAVASIQVHLPNGFFAPNGYEYTLMLAGAALGLALTGPGRFSLDALIARRRHAPAAGETGYVVRSGQDRRRAA